MKVKKIKDEMYKRDIFLITDFESKKFYKKFNEVVFTETLDDFFRGYTLEGRKKNGGGIWFIILNKHEDDFELKCTLIHELFHLTLMIAEYNGFEITKESDEPLAYYNEHLYKQFIKII